MALRQALARGLARWGRPVGQQVAGQWTEAALVALAPTKVGAGAVSASWQQAGGLRCLSTAAAAAVRAGTSSTSSASAATIPAVLLPAAGLRRAYTSSARDVLHEATQRLRAAAGTVKAAGSAVSKAPEKLYQALPVSAKQLVNAAQTPGAVNRVISLQLTAFWQNHHNAIIAVGAVALCYGIWRVMYKTSQAFVELSDTVATSGFFALAASMVAFGYLYLRRRYTIDPKAAYRLAMYRLNTHPGLLEVMGAPLVGSPVQASVLTGGNIKFKGLRPKLQSKRLQMIFPLKGAERRGLVSLEAKKRHGQMRLVLLAVDVPSVSGGEQRIYLEGGPALYERGGVLGVLRDPFIRALSMEETFMAEDEAEDEEEQRAAAAAAVAKAAAAAAKQPKPLDQGGGMYFYERAIMRAREAWARGTAKQQQQAAGAGSAPAGKHVVAAGAAHAA